MQHQANQGCFESSPLPVCCFGHPTSVQVWGSPNFQLLTAHESTCDRVASIVGCFGSCISRSSVQRRSTQQASAISPALPQIHFKSEPQQSCSTYKSCTGENVHKHAATFDLNSTLTGWAAKEKEEGCYCWCSHKQCNRRTCRRGPGRAVAAGAVTHPSHGHNFSRPKHPCS